jgi:hypothetical protein
MDFETFWDPPIINLLVTFLIICTR